jgi:hypothetical protein
MARNAGSGNEDAEAAAEGCDAGEDTAGAGKAQVWLEAAQAGVSFRGPRRA